MVAALLSLAFVLVGCGGNGAGGGQDTTGEVLMGETVFSRGEMALSASGKLFSDLTPAPVSGQAYQREDATPTRKVYVEGMPYEVAYRDTSAGQYMDSELDRYTINGALDLAVWYKAGSDEVVSLEWGLPRDPTRDGEAVLTQRAEKLLKGLCDLDLASMERTYTYVPKVEAQNERLVTVRYAIERADGRSYCYAEVDFHINMISVIIYNEPEPDQATMDRLLAANEELGSYLKYGRGDGTPAVVSVSGDARPAIYQKNGKWMLETKRTVTYMLGKNEMTRSITFYVTEV